jgi:hypothetical protein
MFRTEFTVEVSGLKKATPTFLFLEFKEVGTARQTYEVFIMMGGWRKTTD